MLLISLVLCETHEKCLPSAASKVAVASRLWGARETCGTSRSDGCAPLTTLVGTRATRHKVTLRILRAPSRTGSRLADLPWSARCLAAPGSVVSLSSIFSA